MHFEKGKKQISSTVSLDDDDIETFKKLSQLGIELDVRGVPSDQRKNLMSLL